MLTKEVKNIFKELWSAWCGGELEFQVLSSFQADLVPWHTPARGFGWDMCLELFLLPYTRDGQLHGQSSPIITLFLKLVHGLTMLLSLSIIS